MYSTQDEIRFVTDLGNHIPRSHAKTYPQTRRQKLVAYRQAMRLRTRWAGIDPEAVAREVDALIRKEHQRAREPG